MAGATLRSIMFDMTKMLGVGLTLAMMVAAMVVVVGSQGGCRGWQHIPGHLEGTQPMLEKPHSMRVIHKWMAAPNALNHRCREVQHLFSGGASPVGV